MPPVSHSSTLEYYNKSAANFAHDTQAVDFQDAQQQFLKHLAPHAKILDFGCGAGRDAKCFKELGFEVEATDGSEELCKIANAHAGLHVKRLLFHELSKTNRYDGIWACASVLHLPKDELKHVIDLMTAALKPSGYMYMSFKYGEFEGFRSERYYTDFTEESFKAFIADYPELRIAQEWVSGDVREGREREKWLNVIIAKEASLTCTSTL